jgi:hypothetical protein
MQESSRDTFSGFPLEFTPYLIRGGNDETSGIFYAVLNSWIGMLWPPMKNREAR